MKLVETVAEDVTIVEASGRLDSTTSKVFVDRLISLLQSRPRAILVDLKNIAYISSSGFHALLIASRAATDKGRQVRALWGDRRSQAAVRHWRLQRRISDLCHSSRWNRQTATVTAWNFGDDHARTHLHARESPARL